MSETAVRVGLVDDQALVRKGLRAILAAHSGLTVAFEAEDGAVALEQLMQVEVDILLCDIRMPVVDGIEVVELLRQGANRLPVLLLTTIEDATRSLGSELEATIRCPSPRLCWQNSTKKSVPCFD